jgi:dihydroorotate dehydrogenase electron transfer subunit
MRSPPAELLERREILPGRWLLTFRAPAPAVAVRAGQVVHVRPADGSWVVGRLPFPVLAADGPAGTVAILVADGSPGGAALHHVRPGDAVELLGPFGRAFEVDPRSRHLLLVAEGSAIAAVRLLADEAILVGRSVVVLAGAASSRDVFPSSLLPDEVEYVVATADGSLGVRGSVVDLVPEYEAWADQAFASGPTAILADLARLAAGRRDRLGVANLGRKRGGGRPVVPGSPEARRKAFLQVVPPHELGCALGTCLGCVVSGTGGSGLRVCREGPPFAADELAWEGAG